MGPEVSLRFERDHLSELRLFWGREARPLWETLAHLPAYQAVKWVDRFNPLEAISAEWAVARVLEKAFEVEVPPRAEGLRTAHAEFHRLSWYFNYLAKIFSALDDRPRTEQCNYLREMVFNGMELFTGTRVLPHLFSLGGISRDLSLGESRKFHLVLGSIQKELDFFFARVESDLVLKTRLKGLLPIKKEICEAHSWGGPVGHASGYVIDLRQSKPYGIYGKLTVKGFPGLTESAEPYAGDCWSRLLAAFFLIRQSLRLCAESLSMIEEGPHQFPGEPKALWPKGEWTQSVEGASGPIRATLVNGKIRLSSSSTRIVPLIEKSVVGLHRDDWRVGFASLGFEMTEGDLA